MSTNQFSQTITVEESMSAAQVGSGLLPVFSTPSMIALMENTAMQIIELAEGESSVGTQINAQHMKASKMGEVLTCTAVLKAQEGRKYLFEVEVKDSQDQLVGKAEHERFVINVERFMSKL